MITSSLAGLMMPFTEAEEGAAFGLVRTQKYGLSFLSGEAQPGLGSRAPQQGFQESPVIESLGKIRLQAQGGTIVGDRQLDLPLRRVRIPPVKIGFGEVGLDTYRLAEVGD